MAHLNLGSAGSGNFRGDGLPRLPRPAHRAHLAAPAAAAIEHVLAVRFQASDDHTGGKAEAIADVAVGGVDVTELALVVLHGGVPQLAVHPGHTGDEAVRLDGAQDRPGVGVDLVDLAVAVLTDPQPAF